MVIPLTNNRPRRCPGDFFVSQYIRIVYLLMYVVVIESNYREMGEI